jgi:ATP-dependent RNA helicase DeaD
MCVPEADQDLVGAIAGESTVAGRDIGTIEISDRFCLVELPDRSANEVIAALRRTTVKGKKVTGRRAYETPTGRTRR